MKSKSRDLQGFAVLLIALIAGGYILLRNTHPQLSYSVPGPTASQTPRDVSWEQMLQEQLINGSTALPTRDLPAAAFVAPTLPPLSGTLVLVQPTELFQPTTPTPTRFIPVGPTRAGPTAVPSPTSVIQVVANNRPSEGQFSPPPEIVPLSMDPRDHFWFKRPVDASANSTALQYYPYGSDGPQANLRIHHGIDLPNPIGKEVYAAGPGHVVWAADNYRWVENGKIVDAAESYGNVVVVEHDFGFDGQLLWTLYAHLSVILVRVNQRVQTGDVIGLSGQSGNVSGPHVHFEVRVGDNNYANTRNPILWMAPYLDHGVIAGRIAYQDGTAVEDASVSLNQNGRVIDTTTTYVMEHLSVRTHINVNSDDVWKENFVFGDVPAGIYQVSVNLGGFKLSKDVNVRAGTTSYVDLGQAPIAAVTATPVGSGATPVLAP
ncbi:MAG TPA: peptidoglycan DD-metalloendopeptidase family protein [Aggregatilineales bacterium]|nr:peptidoglycan DD-metalloendopeptidase family protein [Aggregatilineales bacterium]